MLLLMEGVILTLGALLAPNLISDDSISRSHTTKTIPPRLMGVPEERTSDVFDMIESARSVGFGQR
jgi:hypothetical protein